MSEQFGGMMGSTQEKDEKEKTLYDGYSEMANKELDIRQEIQDIMEEIDTVFKNTPGRAEAEKIVLEKYAPQLEDAQRRAAELNGKGTQALNEWLSEIRTS